MRRFTGWLVFVPFALFLLVFAVIPAAGMWMDSFRGDTGGLTLAFYQQTLHGMYLRSFMTTIRLSLESGVIGVVLGAPVTWALVRSKSDGLRKLITSISSIMANFAGLPLAVAFMVTLGTSGLVTVVVSHLLHVPVANLNWNLSSFNGLLLIYSFFQVPLAIVLLVPAVSSLQREWEEAVYTLGASIGTYLRKIVLPLMLPGLLGTLALLFSNAFSAYVTAFAIAGGTVDLIPIQIGYLIDGNLTLDIGLGDALAIEEMIVLGLAVTVFLLMQRFDVMRASTRGKSVVS